ncbi:hypothetical protein MKL09_14365 [Methylobacterium sp. J-048]|uniref:hypothetical protein n=1 Tax=Methylobacterium sp. J-048 TaxID=2836635 RepID=UPI001FB86D84|nr:hypothetical protein [Methylobacterium sp. J-048]MCJ2057735.1 hypothetical protein [Methylobacterium sp. J-048]
MPSFKVAHIRRSGQDMILVPLSSNFDYKSEQEQLGVIEELQERASSAGMAGSVVPVWQSGNQMKFRAPPPWHGFIKSIGMNGVMGNINKTLYW